VFTPVGELLDHPPQDVDSDTLAEMPAALAARPWHPRLRVPVPVMNVHTDDEHPTPFVDFLGVDPQVAVRCARERRCGICGIDLDEELAFLGTVESVRQHVFSDPPLHEHCAQQALRWCPHLRLHNHQRAPQHRRHPDTPHLDGWTEQPRPDRWALGIATQFTILDMFDLRVFRPHRYRRTTIFAYTGPNNTLVAVAHTTDQNPDTRP
jgi:hypothetical protein